MGDGCAITETLATICTATPPLPATGSNSEFLLGAVIVFVTGFIVSYARRRR